MDADERRELFAHFFILFAPIIVCVDRRDAVNTSDWFQAHFNAAAVSRFRAVFRRQREHRPQIFVQVHSCHGLLAAILFFWGEGKWKCALKWPPPQLHRLFSNTLTVWTSCFQEELIRNLMLIMSVLITAVKSYILQFDTVTQGSL